VSDVPEHGSSPEVDRRIVVDRQPVVAPDTVRVLVTNDDGIDSPGIVHLAHALARDFDVTVAAPAKDSSGAGTGIGRYDPKAGIELRRADIGLPRAYAIDGPPGLAVMAAALGAFGDPFHVVVSGINAGINTGHSVIHSGTVGAALTARTFGSHGLAMSIEPSDPWQWATAAEIAVAVTHWITATTRDPSAFSVNVPGVAIEDVLGLRCAELDRFGYFRVAIADEGGQKLEFELASEDDRDSSPGCDTWLVRNRYATITELGELTSSRDCVQDQADTIWRPPATLA
jgi:5'-nucleotidase